MTRIEAIKKLEEFIMVNHSLNITAEGVMDFLEDVIEMMPPVRRGASMWEIRQVFSINQWDTEDNGTGI